MYKKPKIPEPTADERRAIQFTDEQKKEQALEQQLLKESEATRQKLINHIIANEKTITMKLCR